ncbi:hypothetical protein [Pseudomonas nitroreducens]|uniref:hypothetical protein n=1 Tax=Pseudomonas nitroreducens TaxID=46680 RepID=UPI003D2AA4AB
MSQFHIQEGKGNLSGRTYYRVFLGNKALGEAYKTRAEAEGYIQLLEKRQQAAAAEREAERVQAPTQDD